nr:hypothetical protein [Tanacetum cinerariifolium]
MLIDHPIGLEECATWDGGKGTWGGRAKGFGTAPVCVHAQEKLGEGVVVLAGKDESSWVRISSVSFLMLQIRPCSYGFFVVAAVLRCDRGNTDLFRSVVTDLDIAAVETNLASVWWNRSSNMSAISTDLSLLPELI